MHKKIVFAVVLVLMAVVAYSIAVARQKRAQQRAIAALVADTTAQLSEALAKTGTPEQTAKVNADLEALRALEASRSRPFADAAEQYLVAARAIMERSADRARLRPQAAASREALLAHMAGASRRNNAWIGDAMALKKRVDQDYFDLDVALNALVELLESMSDADQTLSQYLDRSLILEESIRDVYLKQVRADLLQAREELGQMRRLVARG